MKTIFNVFDNRKPTVIWQISLLLIIGIIIVDIFTNNIISCEPFLIFPIVLTSWYGSKKTGVLLSIVTSLFWLSINLYFISKPDIYWPTILNGLTQLLSYVLLAIVITNFRKVHRHEEIAADTDNLTGLLNSRGFYVELADEIFHSIRYKHVFSLAYIDVDNFKNINDTLGHATGDILLKDVATCLKSSLRKTDKIGRIGGDEFICLLPETQSEDAKAAFKKVTELLSNSMKNSKWNVSFSIGLITFITPPEDIKQAVKYADELMYSVKKDGKNNIIYRKIG